MSIDNLISLLSTSLIIILVGIFLTPVIRDLAQKGKRQEYHPPLEDLIKQKERNLQVGGFLSTTQVELWKQAFPQNKKLIADFITWGDPELLNQVNEKIDIKITARELKKLFEQTPPSPSAIDGANIGLIETLLSIRPKLDYNESK